MVSEFSCGAAPFGPTKPLMAQGGKHHIRLESDLVPLVKKEAEELASTPPKRVNRIVRDHFEAKKGRKK